MKDEFSHNLTEQVHTDTDTGTLSHTCPKTQTHKDSWWEEGEEER